MRRLLSAIALGLLTGCSQGESPVVQSVGEDDGSTSQLLVERLSSGMGAADQTAVVRSLLPLATKLIQEFEGWSSTAYDDPAGYCTIGFGRLLALKRCADINIDPYKDGISIEVGENYLEEDTRYARSVVARLVQVEINDHQFGALTSFVYNVGERNFQNSTMLRLLNSGQPALAGREFRRWVKAKGTILPGLVARRDCEHSLFNGMGITRTDGSFDRSMCQSLGAAIEVGEVLDIETGE